ncbi:hypothetical protein T01_10664 [Trichinella spiralis]|uniref:Uncharacterized protein n=1 Tax=Trichinella spiralis TaxID=6334 RepID=A0A0V1B435_TRISP|nr:hypothetical protein T01_10664 [Trichinella spiralis]
MIVKKETLLPYCLGRCFVDQVLDFELDRPNDAQIDNPSSDTRRTRPLPQQVAIKLLFKA